MVLQSPCHCSCFLEVGRLTPEKWTSEWTKTYTLKLNWEIGETEASLLGVFCCCSFLLHSQTSRESEKGSSPLQLSQQHKDSLLSSRLTTLFRSYYGHKQSYLRKIRVGTTSTVCQRNSWKRHMPMAFESTTCLQIIALPCIKLNWQLEL